MLKSVDFPEPDGPMIETNSPFCMENETPRSARVEVSSSRNSFFRSRTSIILLLFQPDVEHLFALRDSLHYLDDALLVLYAEHDGTCNHCSVLEDLNERARVILQNCVLRQH